MILDPVKTRIAGELELISTDAGADQAPTLKLYRNSATPAAADEIGSVDFVGEDDGGAETTYGQLIAVIDDPTNGSEDSSITFFLFNAGTFAKVATLGGAGLLELEGGITAKGNSITVGDTGQAVNFVLASGGTNLNFRNAETNGDLQLDFPASGGVLNLRTHNGSTGTTITSLDAAGVFTHNAGSVATADAVFKGDTDASLFVVNAGSDRVGVSTASMRHGFDCRTSRGYSVVKKTGNYTLTDANAIIYADAASLGMGATLTITLPTVQKGRIYEVYRKDDGSGGQNVEVAAPSGTFLNGVDAGTVALSTQFDGVRIVGIDATDDWIAHELTAPAGGP